MNYSHKSKQSEGNFFFICLLSNIKTMIKTYLVGECVVAKGTILERLIDSKIVDSVMGRYCKSSMDGNLWRPTTWSNSSCTRFMASGLRNIKTLIHNKVVLMVSMPAENKSIITCTICSSVIIKKIKKNKN